MTPAAGRPRLDQAVVRRFRRERIVAAMAAEVRRRGYRRTTVAHLVATAGIARNTFYENFPNKEAVFLAGLQQGYAELAAAARSTCPAGGPDRAAAGRAALGAVLGWIAEHPDLAYLCLIAAPEGGEPAMAARSAAEDQLAALLGEAEGARFAGLLCMGVAFVLARLLLAGAAAEAPRHLDDLARLLDLAGPLTSTPDRRRAPV
jgi:AcrR family transcriptional regulator